MAPPLPECVVTPETAVRDGIFVSTSAEAGRAAPPPRYNHTCWLLKARFHDAPACVAADGDALPLHGWRWTLRAALEGRCVMPSTTPPDVAAAAVRRRAAAGADAADARAAAAPPTRP